MMKKKYGTLNPIHSNELFDTVQVLDNLTKKYDEVNQRLNPILMKIQSTPDGGMSQGQEQAFTDDPVVDEVD